MLNGGLVFHELVVRHLGIQSPTAPHLRSRLACDMGQLMNLQNIQIISARVTLVDPKINAMSPFFKTRIAVHRSERSEEHDLSFELESENIFHILKMFTHTGFFAMRIQRQKLAAEGTPIQSSQEPMHYRAVIKNVVDHMLHRIEIVGNEFTHGGRLFPPARALDQGWKKVIDFHPPRYTIFRMESPLLLRVRKELKRVADPEKAQGMQAYMKSQMPYHGVQTPILRKTLRGIFKEIEIRDSKHWEKEILALWRNARFREERYAAINLAGDKRAREFHKPSAMKMFEEMIVSGAWWDYVDAIASQRVGAILEHHPDSMKRLMRRWSRDKNMWKRRTSIISQLGFKKNTDLELLFHDCIEPSLGSERVLSSKRNRLGSSPGCLERSRRNQTLRSNE